MPVIVKCDVCGKEEPARPHQENTHKPMWAEPHEWLRRFDGKGRVIALACGLDCDKLLDKGNKRKPGT